MLAGRAILQRWATTLVASCEHKAAQWLPKVSGLTKKQNMRPFTTAAPPIVPETPSPIASVIQPVVAVKKRSLAKAIGTEMVTFQLAIFLPLPIARGALLPKHL